MPFFTIITATYNAAATLPRLLDSLSEQTCRDFELIIQDGASTDDTVAVAESYRDKLPALSLASEPDTGIYDAWNKALGRIRGAWVLFLGADDRLAAADVLENVVAALDAQPTENADGLLFASGGVAVTTAADIPLRYIPSRTIGAVRSLRAAAMPVPFPGLFVRSSLLTLHRFDASLRIAGDYEFLCQTWREDSQSLRLPFLVTNMTTGGLSSQQAYAAFGVKETIDAADRHYGNAWTPKRRRDYRLTRILSALYTFLPHSAPWIHNALRRIRNKSSLPVWQRRHAEPLPLFSPKQVPIFIISFNRLVCLHRLINWLEENGLTNIIIVDNASTYPPLLEYLDSLPYRVVRLPENKGHLAVWQCGLFSDILDHQYFVVTDPDVLPDEACPEDAILCFYNQLMAYPPITKCGFSLRLDDIPFEYPLREPVLEMEGRYWQSPLPDGSGFFAPIDTTFALYRPGIKPDEPRWFKGIRLAPPYVARHLPWYELTADDESRFYTNCIKTQSSFWSAADNATLKKENLALRAKINELEHQVDLLSKSLKNQAVMLCYNSLRSLKKKIFHEKH
ncbi:glycosyltransferase [Desulfovibrio legallii]|uniref:Glycosyl transferase family 2 n=1 Tax=Desulfovibrio legallii TaxID=571438 RepID=A0A1G7J6U2_9BACT|nr:glycosyltransferase [Desulfovibrio legallii]SDF20702.1 Glycosyl transferase family 2 [Desulfovibrio legallii]